LDGDASMNDMLRTRRGKAQIAVTQSLASQSVRLTESARKDNREPDMQLFSLAHAF
jgi:hypothetical protein